MKHFVLAILLAAGGTAHAAVYPPGTVIDNAVSLDVTPAGFDAIAGIIPGLLPASIDIPDTSDSGGTWCFNYAYALSNAWVGIEVIDANITPADGYLDVSINLMVSLNDSTDPFYMDYELACISDSCDGHVNAFPVTVTTTIALAVVTGTDGTPALDATIGDIALDLSGFDPESDIDLGSCGIETIKDILGFFGIDLYGWVVGLIEPTLESTIADLGPTLETTIEDAFSQASIEQDLDLNGSTLHVQLQPSNVVIQPSGVRVDLSGALSTATPNDCIADYDPGGSLATPSDEPTLGEAPVDVSDDFHMAANVSDDFANQGLYALWEGGLLCYTVGADAGLPLDTSTVLGVLAGDAFDELFPEAQPVTIQTRPKAAPTLDFTGSHDINVNVQQLGLEVYANVDGRLAQVVGLDLGVLAGADLDLDGTTGDLGIGLDLGTDAMTCSVIANELEPDATSSIETQCASALGSLAGTLVGSLLPDLAFTLPSFGAYGVSNLEVATTGPSSDWLGMYARIGEVPYGSTDGSTGCASDGSGGCGGSSSGCSSTGGCSSGGGGANRWGILLFPLALAFFRRRP